MGGQQGRPGRLERGVRHGHEGRVRGASVNTRGDRDHPTNGFTIGLHSSGRDALALSCAFTVLLGFVHCCRWVYGTDIELVRGPVTVPHMA